MGLDLMLRRDPNEWDGKTDRHTDLMLYGRGWEVLFFEVLGCPNTEFLEGDDYDTWYEYWEEKFREAIPEYPLLGRISDYYQDVWYAPDELTQLRNECQSVLIKTHDKDAIEALETLLAGCNKAQQSNLGLFLGAD